ncbi:hypothetical protein BC941DRAFT_100935 [Chlamydoabsidia padenii]|nr:hypothetical protein BC941DRAFT_100935 [Chlamydoabsidia padenii]
MQVIFLLTTIQTINQGKERTKATIGTKKKRRDYLPDIGQANLTSDNPEDQLEIYFDRIFIWEQVSNVVGFLQERDAEAAEQSTARLDPADIYIHQFCSHLEKCFVKKLPKLIGKLWEKVDKDDDKDDFDDVFPTPNKRRKTLLEMRMRGDSPGETMTANWIGDSQESTTFTKNRYHRQSSSSSQPSNQQHVESPSSGASKRKQSMFPILPFMKREIIMSKSVNTKPKPLPETTTTDTKPSFRRTGSFTKSATSPKRNYVKRKTTTETNTVVLRKRVPNSPTTPRTRLAREFGISMTPRTTSSSTNSSNNVDMPVTSSTSLMASLMATSPHRPKSTREFGIAVSPARSAARKIIGHKSPRAHRTGSARDSLYAGDEDTTSDGPRDLTNALMAAARHPTKTIYRAKPDIRKTFSSLFDD